MDRQTDRQIQINVIKMRDKGKNVSAAKDALDQHEGGWNQLAWPVHAAGTPDIAGRPRTLISRGCRIHKGRKSSKTDAIVQRTVHRCRRTI